VLSFIITNSISRLIIYGLSFLRRHQSQRSNIYTMIYYKPYLNPIKAFYCKFK